MSFLDKFKRKGIKVSKKTTNINPLYTARLVDIPNLDEYYDKSEIDEKLANQVQKEYVDNADSALDNKINNNVRTLTESINGVKAKVNENTTKIETNKNNLNNLKTQLSNANIASYIGDWTSSKSYKIGNIVSYGAYFWLAVKDSSNQTPSETSTYWKILTFTVDTSDFAVTNQSNIFTAENHYESNQVFNQGISVENRATFNGDISFLQTNTHTIKNLKTPIDAFDAANKAYVDAQSNDTWSKFIGGTSDAAGNDSISYTSRTMSDKNNCMFLIKTSNANGNPRYIYPKSYETWASGGRNYITIYLQDKIYGSTPYEVWYKKLKFSS